MAGPRTVPVEMGVRYTDEDWSQKLMTLSDFIDKHVLCEVYTQHVLVHLCSMNLPVFLVSFFAKLCYNDIQDME